MTNEAGLQFKNDTPEKIITELQRLYQRMDAVDSEYDYMWSDALAGLDELRAEAQAAYESWQESQPKEDNSEHSTMNHVDQGTKP